MRLRVGTRTHGDIRWCSRAKRSCNALAGAKGCSCLTVNYKKPPAGWNHFRVLLGESEYTDIMIVQVIPVTPRSYLVGTRSARVPDFKRK